MMDTAPFSLIQMLTVIFSLTCLLISSGLSLVKEEAVILMRPHGCSWPRASGFICPA